MSQPPTAPCLAVVPPDEYQQFADALREFRPHSYQVEGMLRGHLKYGHFDILDARLYAPTDAVHRHHMAVILPVGTSKNYGSLTIYWDEHHLSDDDVVQLLRSLPFDSWKDPFMIRQMPMHLQHKMDAIMSKLSDGELHLFSPIPIRAMLLTPDNTPPVPKLPDGYYFGALDESFAQEILQRWIGAFTETLSVFSHFLDTLPSVAVFYKKHPGETHDQTASNGGHAGELVSYAVYKHGSDVGMTFTKEDHRRKGLASAATIQLAHKLHQDDIPVTVIIDYDYETSIKMHKSIGFTHYCDAAIPIYFPKNNEFESSPIFLNFVKGLPESVKRWNETPMGENSTCFEMKNE